MSSPLTDKINALTTYANEITGESDTTLSDAVATLASGYGQGGGNAVRSGTYTPASDTTGPSFDVGDSNVTHFLIFATTSLLNSQSKKMFECGYTEFGETDEFSITSNNTGGGPVTRLYQDSWWSKSGSVITCNNTGTSGIGAAGYFVAGATYKWYAW